MRYFVAAVGRRAQPRAGALARRGLELELSTDPFERGERAHLNFGHTFGHAIETTLNYAKSHGECIGLGMTAGLAGLLAHAIGTNTFMLIRVMEGVCCPNAVATIANLRPDQWVNMKSSGCKDLRREAGDLFFVFGES